MVGLIDSLIFQLSDGLEGFGFENPDEIPWLQLLESLNTGLRFDVGHISELHDKYISESDFMAKLSVIDDGEFYPSYMFPLVMFLNDPAMETVVVALNDGGNIKMFPFYLKNGTWLLVNTIRYEFNSKSVCLDIKPIADIGFDLNRLVDVDEKTEAEQNFYEAMCELPELQFATIVQLACLLTSENLILVTPESTPENLHPVSYLTLRAV